MLIVRPVPITFTALVLNYRFWRGYLFIHGHSNEIVLLFFGLLITALGDLALTLLQVLALGWNRCLLGEEVPLAHLDGLERLSRALVAIAALYVTLSVNKTASRVGSRWGPVWTREAVDEQISCASASLNSYFSTYATDRATMGLMAIAALFDDRKKLSHL